MRYVVQVKHHEDDTWWDVLSTTEHHEAMALLYERAKEQEHVRLVSIHSTYKDGARV